MRNWQDDQKSDGAGSAPTDATQSLRRSLLNIPFYRPHERDIMRASRSNLLNSELRICIPVTLSEMVEGAEVNKSSQRAKVIAALKASPEGMSIEEITMSADLPSRNSVDAILLRMVKDGEVVRLARCQCGLPDPDIEQSA